MTAEVAIMNRQGVALAADSALTITVQQGAGRWRKIFISAEKLFQLNTAMPIGIMIYGSAQVAGMPWETVIKEYRKANGGKVFPRLKDYAEDFLKFLERSRALAKDGRERETRALIGSYLVSLLEVLKQKFAEENPSKTRKINERDIARWTETFLKERISEIRTRPHIPAFAAGTSKSRQRWITRSVNQITPAVLGKWPLSRLGKRRLHTLIKEVLTRCVNGPTFSGVAVAGFGESEYLPSLVNLIVDGFLGTQPRAFTSSEMTIGINSEACVSPFAQEDMVWLFMEGLTKNLRDAMNISAKQVLHIEANKIVELVEKDSARIAKKLGKKAEEIAEELADQLISAWQDLRKTEHVDQIMPIVSSLPKDDLGSMAEDLVSLTRFRRRVSREEETVGGPIDVAIITKGDGFVWMRRKHYFDPALNPRAITKYTREVQ